MATLWLPRLFLITMSPAPLRTFSSTVITRFASTAMPAAPLAGIRLETCGAVVSASPLPLTVSASSPVLLPFPSDPAARHLQGVGLRIRENQRRRKHQRLLPGNPAHSRGGDRAHHAGARSGDANRPIDRPRCGLEVAAVVEMLPVEDDILDRIWEMVGTRGIVTRSMAPHCRCSCRARSALAHSAVSNNPAKLTLVGPSSTAVRSPGIRDAADGPGEVCRGFAAHRPSGEVGGQDHRDRTRRGRVPSRKTR